MKRFAVIDLGTNTFHLLIIGRKSPSDFIEIYRERIFVKMAEAGIMRINRSAFKRGLEALQHFRDVLDLFEVVDYRAFATAAFRNAANARHFMRRSEQTAGIRLEVISGKREAELIFKGVLYSGALDEKRCLIMDIGGGSVEFIVCNKDQIFWSQSYEIGAAILHREFHRSEPIHTLEQLELRRFLNEQTADMRRFLQDQQLDSIIGASGTFDVLADQLPNQMLHRDYHSILIEDFQQFRNKLVGADYSQRLAMEGIPKSRADFIVVALILIDFVLSLGRFGIIKVSPYALKEGMIREMMENYRQI